MKVNCETHLNEGRNRKQAGNRSRQPGSEVQKNNGWTQRGDNYTGWSLTKRHQVVKTGEVKSEQSQVEERQAVTLRHTENFYNPAEKSNLFLDKKNQAANRDAPRMSLVSISHHDTNRKPQNYSNSRAEGAIFQNQVDSKLSQSKSYLSQDNPRIQVQKKESYNGDCDLSENKNKVKLNNIIVDKKKKVIKITHEGCVGVNKDRQNDHFIDSSTAERCLLTVENSEQHPGGESAFVEKDDRRNSHGGSPEERPSSGGAPRIFERRLEENLKKRIDKKMHELTVSKSEEEIDEVDMLQIINKFLKFCETGYEKFEYEMSASELKSAESYLIKGSLKLKLEEHVNLIKLLSHIKQAAVAHCKMM